MCEWVARSPAVHLVNACSATQKTHHSHRNTSLCVLVLVWDRHRFQFARCTGQSERVSPHSFSVVFLLQTPRTRFLPCSHSLCVLALPVSGFLHRDTPHAKKMANPNDVGALDVVDVVWCCVCRCCLLFVAHPSSPVLLVALRTDVSPTHCVTQHPSTLVIFLPSFIHLLHSSALREEKHTTPHITQTLSSSPLLSREHLYLFVGFLMVLRACGLFSFWLRRLLDRTLIVGCRYRCAHVYVCVCVGGYVCVGGCERADVGREEACVCLCVLRREAREKRNGRVPPE